MNQLRSAIANGSYGDESVISAFHILSDSEEVFCLDEAVSKSILSMFHKLTNDLFGASLVRFCMHVLQTESNVRVFAKYIESKLLVSHLNQRNKLHRLENTSFSDAFASIVNDRILLDKHWIRVTMNEEQTAELVSETEFSVYELNHSLYDIFSGTCAFELTIRDFEETSAIKAGFVLICSDSNVISEYVDFASGIFRINQMEFNAKALRKCEKGGTILMEINQTNLRIAIKSGSEVICTCGMNPERLSNFIPVIAISRCALDARIIPDFSKRLTELSAGVRITDVECHGIEDSGVEDSFTPDLFATDLEPDTEEETSSILDTLRVDVPPGTTAGTKIITGMEMIDGKVFYNTETDLVSSEDLETLEFNSYNAFITHTRYNIAVFIQRALKCILCEIETFEPDYVNASELPDYLIDLICEVNPHLTIERSAEEEYMCSIVKKLQERCNYSDALNRKLIELSSFFNNVHAIPCGFCLRVFGFESSMGYRRRISWKTARGAFANHCFGHKLVNSKMKIHFKQDNEFNLLDSDSLFVASNEWNFELIPAKSYCDYLNVSIQPIFDRYIDSDSLSSLSLLLDLSLLGNCCELTEQTLISLVKFAFNQENGLKPFRERIIDNIFEASHGKLTGDAILSIVKSSVSSLSKCPACRHANRKTYEEIRSTVLRMQEMFSMDAEKLSECLETLNALVKP